MSKIIRNVRIGECSKLPIMFRSVCKEYEQETLKWPAGYTWFDMLHFVLEGSGIIRCNGEEHRLQRGSAFFVAKGVALDYMNTGGLKSALVSAIGSAPDELRQHYQSKKFICYEQVELDKYLRIIQDIEKEYYTTGKDAKLSSLTYEIFADFFAHDTKKISSAIELAQSYIKRNFNQKITLEQISEYACISVSKLCHDFKKIYGQTVFEFIMDLRLSYAQILLTSDYHIRTKEAAYEAGFEDISYFCRAYKKRFGKTPMEEKANH